MRVVIGTRVYDSRITPISVKLSKKEMEVIGKMPSNGCDVLTGFPDGTSRKNKDFIMMRQVGAVNVGRPSFMNELKQE